MKKETIDWECALAHFPPWVIEYEHELTAILTENENKADYNYTISLLDRYNELSQKEKDFDAFEQYGITDEKDQIIAEIIKIHEKHKDEAIALRERYIKP